MQSHDIEKKKVSPAPFVAAVVVLVILMALVATRAVRSPKATLPLGLETEAYHIPADNHMTTKKIQLGHLLYFDKRLSPDDSVACASCHRPNAGFTDNQPVSDGIRGQKGTRSAPTVINRVFSASQFWDGRAASLEEQAKGPLTNPIEHGFKDEAAVVEKVSSIRQYRELFRAVFNSDVTMDGIAKAIAAFERTVISGNSKYDRYKVGEKDALNAQEIRGLQIFEGKGNCSPCHAGFNFTDEDFHNLGVGMDAESPDLGRYNVTHDESDKGAFKTPTLRAIGKTAPYMHDGSIATLEEVVHFYNVGGHPNSNLSPLIEPLGLSEQEEKDIVAFLNALDGEGWQEITPPGDFPE